MITIRLLPNGVAYVDVHIAPLNGRKMEVRHVPRQRRKSKTRGLLEI